MRKTRQRKEGDERDKRSGGGEGEGRGKGRGKRDRRGLRRRGAKVWLSKEVQCIELRGGVKYWPITHFRLINCTL